MLHRLRGLGLSVRVFEAGSGVGGTWFWNRYPGARCDIESLEYSYQFSDELQQEWEWSERYATQPEILRYLEPRRRPLRPAPRHRARHARDVRALRRERRALDGRDRARRARLGALLHHGDGLPLVDEHAAVPRPRVASRARSLPHRPLAARAGVDFTGQRVGVIGTGSSAIQSIPLIAEQAAQLTVFQRTPNYSIPAHNGPLDPEHAARASRRTTRELPHAARQMPVRRRLPGQRAARRCEVDAEERSARVRAALAARRPRLPRGVRRPARSTTRRTRPPPSSCATRSARSCATRRSPSAALARQVIGCKRLCVDTGYYDDLQPRRT